MKEREQNWSWKSSNRFCVCRETRLHADTATCAKKATFQESQHVLDVPAHEEGANMPPSVHAGPLRVLTPYVHRRRAEKVSCRQRSRASSLTSTSSFVPTGWTHSLRFGPALWSQTLRIARELDKRDKSLVLDELFICCSRPRGT